MCSKKEGRKELGTKNEERRTSNRDQKNSVKGGSFEAKWGIHYDLSGGEGTFSFFPPTSVHQILLSSCTALSLILWALNTTAIQCSGVRNKQRRQQK